MRKLLSTLSSTLQGGVRGGLLLLALVATTSLLAEDFSVGGIYYNYLDGNNVKVTYRGDDWNSYRNEYSGAVIIPSTVTYNGTTYSVTSIGDDAFSDCSSLTSVTIGNSVTSIEEYAFRSCHSLTSVTIPNSVTSIGDRAFYYCSSLTSLTIPNSVTSIGEWAFYYCSSLTSLTIPNSVTSIGEWAFYGCSSLTSITIPESVTSIGNRAFFGCSSLTIPVYNAHYFAYMPTSFKGAYVIPEGIKQIAGGAFADCSSLTSITIPNSVTSIGDEAFADCSSLTSITIPNSVTTVGRGMFYGCSKLKSVVLSNNITSLPSYHDGFEWTYGFFKNCSSLTSVTIPNSVTSIGWGTFSGCSSLVSMVVESGNTKYDSRDNCNAIIETATNTLIAGCQNTLIPYSVTSIGDEAFRGCSSLTSITIPNSVTSIRERAFAWCTSLTSVTIPNSVTSIGEWAFSGCSSLTSVTIPNTVTSIGEWAFCRCSSLTAVTCEAETPPTVGYNAFYDVSRSIPVYVPCGCVKAYKAANGWKNFTNIQEALAEYSIEVDVNDNIMGTATVDINSMCGAHISATANIGYHFVQWSDGNTDNPRTLTLTQDTVLTAEFALTIAGQCGDNLYWSYNESDQTISITGSGKMYDYTADTQPWFLFEEQIMEVITSNTATSIGTSAFEGCLRLGKVSLGAAMENVAANAFAGCTHLYHIYCYPTYPPFADESSFANYNVHLHVPCNNKEEYDLDIIWGNFKYIECLSADEVEDTEDVIIESGTTTIIITWPTEEGADTYTIVIKKDGEVVCTLTFNAEGQLLNIAFAPGRNGNHPVQYAEQAANGYRFTVTGLEEGTDYTYDITVKDASNKTIKSHSGKFTTESLTAVENTHIQSQISNCQKILRNSQLLILRDGVEYNAMGAQIQ